LTTFISPDVFVFDVTAQILSMVLIGGISTTWGPVLGAALLTFLPELLRVSKAYYQLIYGAGIVVLVIFLPVGLAGLLRRWWRGLPAPVAQSAAAASSAQPFPGLRATPSAAVTLRAGSDA